MAADPKNMSSAQGRHYMLSLYRTSSIIALVACTVTFFSALYALASDLVSNTVKGIPVDDMFHYFTINSNAYTAFAASLMIPFAVEGFRKKRFTCPKWLSMLFYSGTICTTLTMVFSCCIISIYDPQKAFGGANFILHIICPLLVLLSFFSVESDLRYTLKDMLICMIPFFIYACVYVVFVMIIGEENGGWEDIYKLKTLVSPFLSIPALILLAFGVASGIRALRNRVSDSHLKLLTSCWRDDMDPVEIKVEVFGLGRYVGMHGDRNLISVPLDIFKSLTARYGIKTEELLKAYIKGVADSLRDRNLL